MLHLLPRLPTSLLLAGPPTSADPLCDTGSLVGPMSSSTSTFLLPFPLPLAGACAECRRKGTDPVVGEERKDRIRTESRQVEID